MWAIREVKSHRSNTDRTALTEHVGCRERLRFRHMGRVYRGRSRGSRPARALVAVALTRAFTTFGLALLGFAVLVVAVFVVLHALLWTVWSNYD